MLTIRLQGENCAEDVLELRVAGPDQFMLYWRTINLPSFYLEVAMTRSMLRELGNYLGSDNLSGQRHTVSWDRSTIEQPMLSCLSSGLANGERGAIFSYSFVDDEQENSTYSIVFDNAARLAVVTFCAEAQRAKIDQPFLDAPVFGLA